MEHRQLRDASGPYLSPDGKYLFFHLNGDIWWVDIRVIENLNPFTGIPISRLLGSQYFNSGKHELAFNLPYLSPGIYTYTLSNGKGAPLSRRLVNK